MDLLHQRCSYNTLYCTNHLSVVARSALCTSATLRYHTNHTPLPPRKAPKIWCFFFYLRGGFTASTMQLQYYVLHEPPFGGGAKCFIHECHTSLLHESHSLPPQKSYYFNTTFFFLSVKYKSFILYSFRSIYGASFNY